MCFFFKWCVAFPLYAYVYLLFIFFIRTVIQPGISHPDIQLLHPINLEFSVNRNLAIIILVFIMQYFSPSPSPLAKKITSLLGQMRISRVRAVKRVIPWNWQGRPRSKNISKAMRTSKIQIFVSKYHFSLTEVVESRVRTRKLKMSL